MKPVDPWQEDLTLAQRALEARQPTLDARHEARLWAAIDQETAEATSFRPWFPILIAASAAVIAGLWWGTRPVDSRPQENTAALARSENTPSSQLPIGVQLVAESRMHLQLGDVDLHIDPDTRFSIQSTRQLNLEQGALTLIPRKYPSTAEIMVAQGRIQSLGGRVTVFYDTHQTMVSVEEGPAAIQPFGKDRIVVESGMTHTISRPTTALPKVTPKPKAISKPAPTNRPAAGSRLSVKEAQTKVEEAQTKVEEARRVARNDASRAEALAQEVLNAQPPPPIRVAAWMVLGDTERRKGAHRQAARNYARVANHPAAGAFLEEALFREAQMLHHLGQLDDARIRLETAEKRIDTAWLEPERNALLARIYLTQNQILPAAEILERHFENSALALNRVRLDVASRLWTRDKARARDLLKIVLETPGPASLIQQARDLEQKISE